MSEPSTPTKDNQDSKMTKPSSGVNLVIKAASQKYPDFTVGSCQPEWSIKQLKHYLSENYPNKPDESSIRLIYSGKLLQDHGLLKDCLRQSPDSPTTMPYIMHLVHSTSSLPSINNSTPKPAATSQQQQFRLEDLSDDDDELTPAGSSASSTVSNTPAFDRRNNNNNSQQSTFFTSQQPQISSATQKEQFTQIYNSLIRHYESLGVPVQSNPWYSSYIQQTALYHYMYSNYLQNLYGLPTTSATHENTSIHRRTVAEQQTPAPAVPVPPPQRRQQPADAVGEEREDWLSLLHNLVSFLLLFSIVFYYASFERFMLVFAVVTFLFMYHRGWLSLQRRRVNPVHQQQPAEAAAAQNQNENAADAPAPLPQQEAQSGILRLIATFVVTFFTSLVPERQRLNANN